jgi:colanic acid/amylovoran biosynthesis glycosyltransferase
MKIALVLSSPPGYSETFFNSLIKGLQENGHEITLYTGYCNSSYSGCKHIKHPKVYKNFLVQLLLMFYRSTTLLFQIKRVRRYFMLEKKEGTSLKRILEKIYLNAELLKFNGEWVHFGFCTTALEREFVPKAIGSKMAVSLRGYDINVFPLKHKGCYNLLWRQVDKVHSISNDLLEKAYRLGLKRDNLMKVIYPAVNLGSLPQLNSNMEDNKLKIVTIARFNWIKGLDFLTEVAFKLKEKEIDYEWVIIGAGNPTEMERYLYDIKNKQLEEHVFHKGVCLHEEILTILKTCDVYVQTSLTEGFCNALLEAQALGIPCVAFNVGGIPENIDHQKTGWLIEPYDVTAMVKRIINISALTTCEKVKLSEVAVKRVRDHFNLEYQKLAFHEFYT